ncbi:MAG: hypothetical protein RMI43_00375 [Candidatus Caldarchaeum sp.]|nr:diphosphomevalonate decarboxylase [Candidatus Caldarchaeum sp.]MDW8062608.1 hypothetical protein [Candidatus Caldarchaeum sp.]
MKAKAVAHPMEGLVKYHGLRDWNLRIPFHDSISVNLDALNTLTEIEFGDFGEDTAIVDGQKLAGREFERVKSVIDYVKQLSGIEENFHMVSRNSIPKGDVKGLGFSSSAGAALATAAYKAAGLDKKFGMDYRLLSRIARRLAGSACRSVVGDYARWFAGTSDEDSYAVRFAERRDFDIRVVVVPLNADFKTEDAHREAQSSPLFEAHVRAAQRRCDELQQAIEKADFKKFGEIVELDALELHAVTSTGPQRMILSTPDSWRVVHRVYELRREGIECYFSMQTGPTVFINTLPENSSYVKSAAEDLGYRVIVSAVGGPAKIL